MNNNENINVIVCMGSACFARGNKKNLEYIEGLIENNSLSIKLELSGNRCEKNCAHGPIIVIDGKIYNNATKKDLKKIFAKHLSQ